MSILCKWGFHSWRLWSEPVAAEWTKVFDGKEYVFQKYVQTSRCSRCNLQRRVITD